MGANRFDTITKAMRSETSRRRALGRLLGGAVGLFGLVHADDAWALDKHYTRDCKKQCGQCEKCEKGECQTKNGKKTCKDGKCKPRANGSACFACSGQTCLNGTCQGGSCAATPVPPPPPPPPFCTGKNFCPIGGDPPLCHTAGASTPCICALTFDNKPICVIAAEVETQPSCNNCTATGRSCLNTSACDVPGEVSCGVPCPSQR